MSTTMSVDYLYRLYYSRSTKEYKLSSKNEENKRTIGLFKVLLICYLLVTYWFTYFATYLIRKTIRRAISGGFKNNELD
jgi:hypothetical protein